MSKVPEGIPIGREPRTKKREYTTKWLARRGAKMTRKATRRKRSRGVTEVASTPQD